MSDLAFFILILHLYYKDNKNVLMCQNYHSKLYPFIQNIQKDRIQSLVEAESPLFRAFSPIFNIQIDSELNKTHQDSVSENGIIFPLLSYIQLRSVAVPSISRTAPL